MMHLELRTSRKVLHRLALVLFVALAWCNLTAAALSPQAVWAAYRKVLAQHPLTTKAATSAVLASISDTISQRVESTLPSNKDQKFHHDWTRTGHILTTGFFYSGPMAHYWFTFLELIVKVENQLLGLICRLLLDATIFSPFTVFGYFSVRTLLEGKGVPAIQQKLQKAWWKAVVAAWKFWPIVNVFNYTLVSFPYRVLYANIMSLLWTGYLTFVNSQKAKLETKK
jgi:protein Mpv17